MNSNNAPEGKTLVEITTDDRNYNDYKAGEVGYIDGYVRGGDNAPYVAVVLGDRVTLIPFHAIKVLRS